MQARIRPLVAHLARILLATIAMFAIPSLALLSALGVFLAIFALVHDLAHGALRLPRRANEVALAIAGVAIATSGHGLRGAHLHHHAHPLAADDLEGAAAHLTLPRALLASVPLSLALHHRGWQLANARTRRWQRVEYAVLATALVGAGLGPHALRGYAAIAVGMQLLAPVWAGHLPHRTPRWIHGLAARLAFTRSPTVLGLLHHAVHHARPKLPLADLRA